MNTFLEHWQRFRTRYGFGKNFIATPVYTKQEDQEILKLFKGYRVADISDGMDKSGHHGSGL